MRCSISNTGKFKIKVGVCQGSCFFSLLLIIVMDAISEHIRREVPWDILYADDLIVKLWWRSQGHKTHFTDWQGPMESI